jgi:hypothetical protein
MKRPITVADILNSVEFELIQHALLQDDVSESIQRLKTYQARTRVELFGQGKSPTFEEVVSAQFNANEMMATLIQVMNQRLEALWQEVRQAAYLKQHAPLTSDSLSEGASLSERASFSSRWPGPSDAQFETLDVFAQHVSNVDDKISTLGTLVDSIRHASLPLEMEVRHNSVPLVGGLLNRVRGALHELVLFYVNKVVRRQTEVNESYSVVLQELVALNQVQAQEIAQLRWLLQRLTTAKESSDTAQPS